MKYDRVVCINLDQRHDKWNTFLAELPADWPFGKVERFSAVDGRNVPQPTWWRGGIGAWGCFNSHRRIIEECLNNGTESVLIFEDDAMFLPGFADGVAKFHAALPSDAQWIYYGGQYIRLAVKLPQVVNSEVFTPFNVNRTHAYGLRGRECMEVVLKHLDCKDWTTWYHIDHHYGRLHQRRKLKVYCPAQWLVDQRAGLSDITHGEKSHHHWKDASYFPDTTCDPFYAVLGCHGSGSSVVAGVLYHLGACLGHNPTGDPSDSIELRQLFESSAPVPATSHKFSRNILRDKLSLFISRRRMEARHRNTIAAGKYPQFATCGNLLHEICGSALHLIICDRDINQSIASLHRRFPNSTVDDITSHQHWIYDSINNLASTIPPEFIHRISFDDLCVSPESIVRSLATFLGTDVTEEQIKNAVDYVQPNRRRYK